MHNKLICILILNLFSLGAVHAQRTTSVTSEEIIQKLTSLDYKIAFDGVDDYMRLSKDERTQEVKAALVQALKNENERTRSIRLQRVENLPVYETEGDAEGSLFLVIEVYELRDPTTIPELLPWCQGGDAMVDFGRVAFEPVLNFVEKPPSGTTILKIGSCMYVLRMMVDYWGVDSFSASERQRMKQVAEKYIENPRLSATSRAISLAYSLNERSVIEMASNLINDDAEMAKRKLGDVDWIQKIISQALAGTLEERQYVPYEERQ